jgi:hypothetical protein
MPTPLSLKEQEIVYKQLVEEQNRLNTFATQATPQLAARVGDIYRNNPQLPAGVVLSSAQAGLPDEQLRDIAAQTALTLNDQPDALKPKKSWFQRNIYDKLKTTTRYTFAALELPIQTLQGAAAQIFSDNPDGIDGWFISTDLGSLIKNDEQAGDGFFLGGEAKQFQTKRVQNYRGTTTGGHAWTIGRGLAGTVTTEGSRAYNLMSGFVDGALTLAVPVAPGFKQVAGLVKVAAEAQGAGKVLKGIDTSLDVVRGKGTVIKTSEFNLAEARKQAGINGLTVDAVEANKFLGSTKGLRLIDKLVEADTADGVRKLIGDKVYPQTVQQLRNAASHVEVENVLADILGVPKLGLTRTVMPGTKLFGISNARQVAVIDNLVGSFENTKFGNKAGRLTTRAFESRPSGDIVNFNSDTPRDVGRTINDLDRWLKVSLTDQDKRVKFLDRALDAMTGPNATPTARKALYDEFNNLVVESWVSAGVDKDVANAVKNSFQGFTTQSRKYGASLDGQIDDGNMYTGIAQKKGKITNASLGGPTFISELANFTTQMPDVRQVRALTGRYNKIWRKNPKGDYVDSNVARLAEAGKLRFPTSAIVGFQEDIFKKIILATGGYTVRNIAEGQISLALSQKPVTSLFRHPLQHMQWSAHRWLGGKVGRKGIGDIRGELFDEAVKGMEDYQRATSIAVTGHYSDPSYPTKMTRRSGTFEDVKRFEAPEAKVVEAHGDQIGLLNADPLVRRVALGDTDDQLIDYIRTNPDGQKWFRDQQDYHINGRSVWDRDANKGRGGWSGKVSIDLNDEHNLRLLLNNYRARFNVTVGGHQSLRIAVSSGLLPPDSTTIPDLIAKGMPWDQSRRGTRVVDLELGNGRKMSFNVDPNDENIIRPFAFKDGEATKELQNLLAEKNIYNDPKLAQYIAHEVRVPADLGKRGVKQNWDSTMDRFFGFMSRKPTAYIERAPAFKQRYYSWAIDELATSLSPADLDILIANVTRKATEAKISPSDYVGDSADFGDIVSRLFKPSRKVVGDRWQKLLDLQANPSRLKGTLSLDDVDEYAKGAALDDLSKMLYDSSERNNLTDVARIIMPFGQAQAEFFRRISRIYTVETGGVALPNLNALRKTQLIVDRGQEADPDGDGRGFFYTDPQTGEWSFDYPFSQGFTHLATSLISGGPGVKATMQAPVKGVLMGLDVKPGFGPVVQLTASALAPDIPQLDFVKSIVLPYGEIDIQGRGGILGGAVDAVTPAYFKKLESIFTSPESANTYGNTFMETYQALATTTKYDLATDDGRDQLYQDTVNKAKFLTVLRALGQFLGPSRPTPKFDVETKQGDVAVNVLSMELRKLQLEDYDTAIPRFLDIYGEDVFVYLSGKTKAVYGGLQASKQFGDFERANKGLFRKFKDVAGFFVEGGTDLDWQVYTRQLETGRRERLTPQETLEAAQKYAAYSQYRQVQDLVGSYPNAEQKQYLRDFREYLGEMYPGFTTGTFDPNKMKNQIDELTRAVNDPSLADNDIAEAARQYLQVREAVLVEAANRGLSGIDRSKNAADLRGYLREYAVTLKEQYPNFARMYDRLLLQEIDE